MSEDRSDGSSPPFAVVVLDALVGLRIAVIVGLGVTVHALGHGCVWSSWSVIIAVNLQVIYPANDARANSNVRALPYRFVAPLRDADADLNQTELSRKMPLK